MTKSKTTCNIFFTAILLAAFTFTACKKSGAGDDSDASLGKASIRFSTSKAFGGKNEFKSNSVTGGLVSKVNTVNKTQISITAVQMNGTQIGTAMLVIHLPQGQTGAISGKFENGSTASTQAVLTIGISNAGASQEAYASKTGNFSITRLTDNEIEGTFDAYCINETTNANINLSSGKFSGKF
ncbi:hypothetical protein [Niabella aurantiaca]|uniref:hypothetical protein n=1 Tax=Niabella aurantiaca TaxID=379900 RepID=UPI000369CEF3|nr:hypothetical protein [Niabella aurantiaca]